MRRSRNAYQSLRSASVGLRRIVRARAFADDGMLSRIYAPAYFDPAIVNCQWRTLTPTLSRKRERGRAASFIGVAEFCGTAGNPSSHLREKAAKRPDEGEP